MRLFSYDNTTQLKDQLQIITDKQITPAHRKKTYDYIWAKQNMHINILNNYKSNKIKALNQISLALGSFILFCIFTIAVFRSVIWGASGFEQITTPFLLIGCMIAVYVLYSIFFYIFSLQRLNFKRYCYYLDKNYLIILLEDADKIKVEKVVSLNTLSVVELDKNSVKIYTDTLTPIQIYCDNPEEINNFISQQISKP